MTYRLYSLWLVFTYYILSTFLLDIGITHFLLRGYGSPTVLSLTPIHVNTDEGQLHEGLSFTPLQHPTWLPGLRCVFNSLV